MLGLALWILSSGLAFSSVLAADCGDDWGESSPAGYCYKDIQPDSSATFDKAVQECSKVGGQLPVFQIDDEDSAQAEYDFFTAVVARFVQTEGSVANRRLWLGYQWKGDEQGWTAPDGTPVVWMNWARGEPRHRQLNQECTSFNAPYLGRFSSRRPGVIDVRCDVAYGYICQKNYVDRSPSYIERVKNLRKRLFKDYHIRHRPVDDQDKPVKVFLAVFIDHIEKLNEKEQSVKFHGLIWMVLCYKLNGLEGETDTQWKDPGLSWNRSEPENEGIPDIWVRPTAVWTPDISVHNRMGGREIGFSKWGTSLLTRVSSNGYVTLWLPTTFYVSCPMDLWRYPYDTQRCPIALGSWMYSSMELRIDYHWMRSELTWRMLDKKSASGWKLEDTSTKHVYWSYMGATDELIEGINPEFHWSVVECWVTVSRVSNYFAIATILPGLLGLVLTLLACWINQQEMVIFLILTTLVIQGVFLRGFTEDLPVADEVPLIVRYFAVHFFCTHLALLVLTLLLHTAQTRSSSALPIPRLASIFAHPVWQRLPGRLTDLYSSAPGDVAHERMVNEEEEQKPEEESIAAASVVTWYRAALLTRRAFFVLLLVIYFIGMSIVVA